MKKSNSFKVSLFGNVKNHLSNSTIAEQITRIKNEEIKTKVEEIRNLIKENKKEEFENAKKSLTAFTVSGTFKDGRKTENLEEYNNCMVLDLDKLQPELITQVSSAAKSIPFTYACFISPSGNGFKIIVKTTATPETHKQVFEKLKEYYETALNIFIDESGSDIPRLCFLSSDPDAYLNEESEVFNHEELNEVKAPSDIPNPEAVFEHLKRYTDKKSTYSDGNRNNYIYLLANNCNRKGLTKEQCIEYSSKQFNLSLNEIKQTVESAYNNEKEHNTDIIISNEERQSIKKIENYLNSNYHFRLNIVTGKIEFKKKEACEYISMTDFNENSILIEMMKKDFKVNIFKLRTILNSDFSVKYDPFLSYLDSLPEWDGTTDYIQQLAETVNTTKNELWYKCFRKWIVAMVGSLAKPEVINQTVIVFSGKQGLGKTTWMEKIVPVQLKEYSYSGTINPDNKDTLVNLTECMLINLDELENLNKSEIGSLKEIITKTSIRVRKPYGRNNEMFIRRASFSGSVNNAQFLNDLTGSRRFLCFNVTKIDYRHAINIDMVMAQAYSLFKSGFSYWFNKDEINEITKSNEEYQIKSPEEELLLTYFKKPEDTEAASYLTATEIISVLNKHAKINTSTTSVVTMGKVLNKYGFKRIKKGGRYVYEIQERSISEVEELRENPILLNNLFTKPIQNIDEPQFDI
jgi:predicted P-loop ATPase